MHMSSFDKMNAFCGKYLSDKKEQYLSILDIGSQDINGSYKPLFDSPCWRYLGVDVSDGNNVDIVLSETYNWKEIKSGSVDVLISGQALEHIEYPWLTMLEIERVLKPDGLCCLIAPAGGFEHRYPVDCWRIYPDGFRALADLVSLEVLEVYAQWESEQYPDGSDVWQDCVLVCRKRKKSRYNNFKHSIARKIFYLTSSLLG